MQVEIQPDQSEARVPDQMRYYTGADQIESDADELSPISASEVSINQEQKLTMLKVPKSS